MHGSLRVCSILWSLVRIMDCGGLFKMELTIAWPRGILSEQTRDGGFYETLSLTPKLLKINSFQGFFLYIMSIYKIIYT